MASYGYGKSEVCEWVRRTFPIDATILDVGACDGAWRNLLPEYPNMDAVEVFEPNADRLTGYRQVFRADIRELEYGRYDLIIFGDVIEHMPVEDAQKVLRYAKLRCRDMIVAVPYELPQGAIYGNPYEVHVQADLTPEIFAERYPGLEVLVDPGHRYCYYHKEPRVAVYSGTRNVYEDMAVSAKSLLINGGVDEVYLLIEDDEFPYPLPENVKVMNVSKQPYFPESGPNYGCRWTYMGLMRAALPKLFPNLRRVLSLDVDTIVTGDITDLWDTRLDGCLMAAAPQPGYWQDRTYVQMGVVLMNLEELRKDGTATRIIEALNTRHYDFPEQDCINELCAGRILELDSKYNANRYTAPTSDPRIIHYAGLSTWRDKPEYRKYKDMEYPGETL